MFFLRNGVSSFFKEKVGLVLMTEDLGRVFRYSKISRV